LPPQFIDARDPGEVDGAFAAMKHERAGALHVIHELMSLQHRKRVADLAAQGRLPTAQMPRFLREELDRALSKAG
jgi:hypothetical protein